MTNKLVVIINSLELSKIKKILLYEMNFFFTKLQLPPEPLTRGRAAAPRSPFSLFSVLNWICWTPHPPEQNSWVCHWEWPVQKHVHGSPWELVADSRITLWEPMAYPVRSLYIMQPLTSSNLHFFKHADNRGRNPLRNVRHKLPNNRLTFQQKDAVWEPRV